MNIQRLNEVGEYEDLDWNRGQACFDFVCSDVLTLSQVSEIWGKPKSSVFNAVVQRKLHSVRRGKIVLISVRSVVALWGKRGVFANE